MKSFTLIETVIAVTIAFLVTIVALNVTKSAYFFVSNAKERRDFSYKATVRIFNDGKNAYEMVRDFNITNDKVISSLKKDKFFLKKEIEYKNKITFFKLKVFDKHHSITLYGLE